MTTQANPHGEATLNPEAYIYAGFFDIQPDPLVMAHASEEVRRALLAEIKQFTDLLEARSNSVYAPTRRCAHCGNGIRYHVLFEHQSTGALVAIGQDCAENRMGLDANQWAERKAQLDAMRAAAREGQKHVRLRKQYPEAVAILEEALEAEREVFRLIDERGRENDEREARGETSRGNADVWKAYHREWPAFVVDIAHRMSHRGKLSERQAQAVVKAVTETRERNARFDAQRAEEAATASPLPAFEGRVELEGEVLTTKVVETDYGVTVKMLVRHADGWKVWGTVPAALDPDGLRGRCVRFAAKVDPSRDDPHFGFFSRPTKAEVITTD